MLSFACSLAQTSQSEHLDGGALNLRKLTETDNKVLLLLLPSSWPYREAEIKKKAAKRN
jgi:hypothetical protein